MSYFSPAHISGGGGRGSSGGDGRSGGDGGGYASFQCILSL